MDAKIDNHFIELYHNEDDKKDHEYRIELLKNNDELLKLIKKGEL